MAEPKTNTPAKQDVGATNSKTEEQKAVNAQANVAEKSKLDADPTEQNSVDNPPPADPALDPEQQAEADKILNQKRDPKVEGDSPNKTAENSHQRKTPSPVPANSEHIAAAKMAYAKLEKMALTYHPDAPDDHIIFGVGPHRFTVGELRYLTNTHR